MIMTRRKIIIGTVVLIALIVSTLMSGRIARRMLVTNLEEATGMQVAVGDVEVSWRKARLQVRDLQFISDASFQHRDALFIKEVDVTYRLASLFSRRPHLTNVLLHIEKAVLVTRPDGVTNLEPLMALAGRATREAIEDTSTPTPDPLDAILDEVEGNEPEQKTPDTPAEQNEEQDPVEEDLRIDRLIIKIGEVETRDYSKGGTEPRIRHYKLNLEQVYVDVTNMDALAERIALDFGLLLGPVWMDQVTGDVKPDADALVETIKNHDGDLNELGRKLDEETKELQRELRKQRRALMEQLGIND
jgi:uncharacterized protein involved in outer membrane biogenesis